MVAVAALPLVSWFRVATRAAATVPEATKATATEPETAPPAVPELSQKNQNWERVAQKVQKALSEVECPNASDDFSADFEVSDISDPGLQLASGTGEETEVTEKSLLQQREHEKKEQKGLACGGVVIGFGCPLI